LGSREGKPFLDPIWFESANTAENAQYRRIFLPKNLKDKLDFNKVNIYYNFEPVTN
jgi:hypothetical protein